MQHRLTALVLAALPVLAACDDDNGTEPQQTALVQFVNASAGTDAATVMLAGQQIASGLTFQTGGSSCVRVPVGSQTLTFQSGGSDIASSDAYNFQADQRYTVVLSGTGDAPEVIVLPELFTAPDAGDNAIRFVNASSTSGDVYVTTPDGALGDTPDVEDLAAGSATGSLIGANAWMSFPTANTRVRLFDVGTTETARTTWTLAGLPANRGTTLVFTDAATAGGATAFQLNQCTPPAND